MKEYVLFCVKECANEVYYLVIRRISGIVRAKLRCNHFASNQINLNVLVSCNTDLSCNYFFLMIVSSSVC